LAQRRWLGKEETVVNYRLMIVLCFTEGDRNNGEIALNGCRMLSPRL